MSAIEYAKTGSQHKHLSVVALLVRGQEQQSVRQDLSEVLLAGGCSVRCLAEMTATLCMQA